VTFAYGAAGLTLVADARLPHLPSVLSAPADLTVHVGRRPAWGSDPMSTTYTSAYTDARGIPVMQLASGADGFSFAYSDGCLFWLDATGSTVWMTYDSTLEDACTYLVGPVLSFALRLRGDFSLHASAVAGSSGAVAFAGPHGVGKSTAAAAFGRCGLPVVTDDILRVTQSGRTCVAHPLGGILRLWPDGECIVFGESDRLERITPNWNKRALSIGAAGVPAADGPVPLAGIVFLMPDDSATKIELSLLSQADAAVHLAANSSAAHLLDAAARTREFHQVAAIASCVPCAVLTRPSISSLADTLSVLKLWMATLGADASLTV
jgi:hypothetical protein